MTTFKRKTPQSVEAIQINHGAQKGRYLVRFPDGTTTTMKPNVFEAEYTQSGVSEPTAEPTALTTAPQGWSKTRQAVAWISSRGGQVGVSDFETGFTNSSNPKSLLNYLTERGYVRAKGAGLYELTPKGSSFIKPNGNHASVD